MVGREPYLYKIRFTPTCVGSTCPTRKTQSGISVHPHMCGEYVLSHVADAACAGSPPHVWGVRSPFCQPRSNRAVHPHMCGEYPRFCPPAHTVRAVHPHMCGEYTTKSDTTTDVLGSPPHVWGVRCRQETLSTRRRFTPTCVGSTGHHVVYRRHRPGSPPHVWGVRCRTPPSAGLPTVHPHMCGEYVHARRTNKHGRAVHPHMCGEYGVTSVTSSGCAGSPPHVWGVRAASAAFLSLSAVHPHMCGEYVR